MLHICGPHRALNLLTDGCDLFVMAKLAVRTDLDAADRTLSLSKNTRVTIAKQRN